MKQSVVLNRFADASFKAYDAVLYIQTYSTNETIRHLLYCKSSVSLTKVIMASRPKLSAYLLAKLISKVLKLLKKQMNLRMIIFGFDNYLSLDAHCFAFSKNFCRQPCSAN